MKEAELALDQLSERNKALVVQQSLLPRVEVHKVYKKKRIILQRIS